jgi:hypothetical protein
MPQVPNDAYPRIHNLLLGQGLFCDGIAVMLTFVCCDTEINSQLKPASDNERAT